MSSLHPIVSQQEPNEEQLPAIITRNCDVVVTAGAGAGKTRTLVARYLALLSEGLPLRSIVAITFTQKAAREMRNRIREALQQYVTQPDQVEAERSIWQQRYSELDAARISTIHSLCTDLLRAHPAEVGLDPNFTVLDEGQAGLQKQQVLAEAMVRAAESPHLVPLFELLGERGLADTLAKLLAQRLEARTCFANLPKDLLSVWGQVLTARQEQILTRLRGEPDWQESVACLAENAALIEADKLEEQRRLAAQALARAVGPLTEQVATLVELDRINLQGGSAKNWPEGKPQVELVKAALRCLRDMWREQAGLLSLTLTPLDEQMVAIMPALQDLFNFMDQRYAALKEELEALDFDDLEDRALDLLQNYPEVRERWQQAVQALLVDEFQDTNSQQRDLLKWLNGAGGKLFIVGDAKQSIYRFRGADVTVFRQERQLIAQNGGTPLTLATSYRAHRGLLEGLNDLLQPVLGLEDPDRPWLEPFARLEPHREQPGAGFAAPHIELHLTVGRKGDGALKRAAESVVGRLVELVESSQVEVGVGAKARPLTYGDITILCRASTSFGPYEDALEAAGVPFLTVAGRGFYNRPEIRDLLNALQALADPSDDLALAGLLRSPALALSDVALYRLRRSRPTPETSLWAMLHQIGSNLPGEDGPRAEHARRLIETLHNQVARITVADLLKEFLDQTGYRAALIGAGQRRAARNVAKLLADASASRLVSVGAFLEYVNGLRATTAREGEAKAPAEGVVQVMSVHAAKGLEFPLVVLGDITHSQSGRNGLLLDPEFGLLLPHRDADREMAASYRLGKLRADDQEGVESDRLLYVAATRAMEKLLLSGCVNLNKDGGLGSLDGWLKRLTGPEGLALTEPPPDYSDQGSAVRQVEFQIGQSLVGCHFYEPLYQSFISAQPTPSAEKEWPSTPLPPDFLAPIVSAQLQPDPLESDRPQRVWRVVPAVARPRAPAWVVGQLVHAALAAWRFPDESFEAWALAQAHNYGLVDERQLANAVQESRRLLQHFQASDLYCEMNQAEQRLHEVPYSWDLEGKQESGIIDALFRHNGTWTLVEFKTDRVWDEAGLNRLLAELDYLSQVRRYTEVVRRMLDQTPRAILCWLNFGDGILVQEIAVEAQIKVR